MILQASVLPASLSFSAGLLSRLFEGARVLVAGSTLVLVFVRLVVSPRCYYARELRRVFSPPPLAGSKRRKSEYIMEEGRKRREEEECRIDFSFSPGKFAASTRRSIDGAHAVFPLISGRRRERRVEFESRVFHLPLSPSRVRAPAREGILFCEYFILASAATLYLLYSSVYLTSQLPFACSHHHHHQPPPHLTSLRLRPPSPLARSHLLDLIEFFPEEEMFPPNESVEILHSDKHDPIFRLIKESLSFSLFLALSPRTFS